MLIDIFVIVAVFDTILRGIMFNRLGVKWWKAIIPFYSTYKLGELGEDKSLGLFNAILRPIYYVYFIFCVGVEAFIVKTYSTQATINNVKKLEVFVPKSVANLSIYSKYWLILFTIIMFLLWIGMMYKFCKKNTEKWSTVLWVVPPVGYLYTIFRKGN